MSTTARLIALFLALFAPLAHAQLNEQLISVTPSAIDYILDSHADSPSALSNLERTYATAEVNFTRVSSGSVQTETYRLKLQLRSLAGTLVPLDNGAGGAATTVYHGPFDFTWAANQTFVKQFIGIDVKPTTELDLNELYRWQVELQRETAPGVFTAIEDKNSTYRRYWHFTGRVPGDQRQNVLARISQIEWLNRTVLRSDPNSLFTARITIEARRYDDWEAAAPVSSPIDFRCQNSLHVAGSNAVVPLGATSNTSIHLIPSIPSHSVGPFIREPHAGTYTVIINVTPSAQIATATAQFYPQVDLAHPEFGGTLFITDIADFNGPTVPLRHYSGQLTASGDVATITGLAQDAAGLDTQNGTHRLTQPVITSGTIAGFPNFGLSSTGTATLRLYDDGHAEVGTGGVVLVPPIPAADFGTRNGIRFQRQNSVMVPSGFTTDLTLILPAGLGVYDQLAGTQPRKRLSARVSAGNQALTQNLAPQLASIAIAPDNVFYFVEESKPVEFATNLVTWDVTNGRISLGPPPPGVNAVRYVRRDQMNALNQSPLSAADKTVRSNDLYFQHVAGTTSTAPVFGTNALGSAITRAGIDIGPGAFEAHFPYGAKVAWDGTGLVDLVADKPNPATSSLTLAQPIEIPWARDCVLPPDANCGTIGDALAKLDPTGGVIGFTADGGLGAKGAMLVNGSRRDVVMGYIAALSGANPVYAHDTDIFDEGSFLSAGHFLPTGETTLGNVPSDSAPGALLNSGFNPNNLAQSDRPGSNGYRNGGADYAGVNLRVANEATPPTATSTLGGVKSPSYTLNNRSKYYVRKGGVSGIHEPTANPFTAPLFIYGYEFTFSEFGLSFLSSEVHDSITAGSLYIPGVQTPASGFTVAFDPLHFSCLGGLTNMKLAGGNFDHRLDFWNADIVGKSAAFQPAIGAECDPSDAYFTLGVGASASNIQAPLSGTLGFKPNGNLITKADALLEKVDSRLVLPSRVEIKGPGNEIYSFYPAQHAYYDNFDHATEGDGGLNFAGFLDVAFFEDLDVHFQTAAKRNDLLSEIHMNAGWTEMGETFFTGSEFDLDHRGYPAGSTRADYRAGTSGETLAAHQELFGVAELNYDLLWDTTTRSFRSKAPKGIDLLVISTEDECVYLSADVAELDFGASIQLDIPEINFANLAEGTPVYAALHTAADALTEEMVDGLELGEEMLNDLMDEFYDDLFDAIAEPQIDALAVQLRGLGEDTVAIEAAVTGSFGNVAGNLRDGMLTKVNDHIDGVQDGLGAVRDGIFGESGGRYALAEGVLKELVKQLQPDTDANLRDNGGYADLAGAFGARSSTIEDVKATLDGIDTALESIQTSLDLADEIAAAFQDGTFLTAARNAMLDELRGRGDLSDYTVDELKDLLRAELRDAFNGSALFAKLSEVLRAYLYELNGAMHEAIDSAFQQVNRVISDLLDDFFPIDGTLRSFLGDVADLCFNGKVDGYARINGDALRTLRLDTEIQAKLPDPFEFAGYIEINQLDSSGTQTCIVGPTNSDVFTEVKMGAAGVPVRWAGSDLEFDIDTKFSFAPQLRGMAGAFEMTKGSIGFEAMKINEFGAAAAFGLDENYVAAKVGILFDGSRMYGGVFFGRTCTYDPLRMVDPDVENVLPAPPLTGAYGYGEAEIPIINIGCLFRVSARAGAGIFVFDADGTEVIGGKMLLGASGRVICAVEAGGEVVLVGAKVGNDFNFFGKGRIYGSAGAKPFKVSFDKSVSITYKNKKWDYDY